MDLYDGPEEKALLVQINVSMINLKKKKCFHFTVIFLTLLDDASEEGQQGFLLKKNKFAEKKDFHLTPSTEGVKSKS